VREAHPIDGAMPGFEQLVEDPVTDAERLHVAGSCMDDLGLTMPALVDGVDDAVCRAYGGWPDRLYLVGKDGRIAYAGAEGPRGFDVEGWGKAIAAERAKLRAGPVPAPAPTDLDGLLEPLRTQFDLPALGAAIVSGGTLVALGTTGVRARGSDVAVEDTDLWHLGSCTKAMTATLAARLVEQGRLQWDSTVGALLPDVAMHEDWRPVRLDWLLQHRGGMATQPPRALWQELWERDEPPQAARAWFVGQLLQAKPDVAPGTKAVYSNQGFNLAGVMLEAAAGGTAWEQLMREHVFTPLGMASAGFGAAGSATRIDQPRGHRDDGRTAVAPGKGADNPASIGPAGTVHASLADWARFVALHLRGARGDKGLLLQPESFLRLHTAAEGSTFAMGWVTAQRPWAGGRTLTHNGSNTLNFCRVWIAPERDHAFLVVTNCAGDAAEKATDTAIGAMVRLRGLAPR